jgi:uroporphyrinogen III methyltransferase / synthase
LGRLDRPLAGRRLILTRAPEQAQEWIGTFQELGAEVILLPMVFFAPPEGWEEVDRELRRLSIFDAILFLSKNAVRSIFDRCAELGIESGTLQASGRFLGAVGPATAQALTEKGIRVDYVAAKRNGESLARELGPSLAGRRVFVPRSNQGDERLSDTLREVGAEVTEVIAYRTVEPADVDPAVVALARRGEVDAMIFASPSAFRNFARAVGRTELIQISKGVSFAAIGRTTADAIRSSGARSPVESEDPSASGIARALVEHFRQPSTSARRP